jgi:hypothetical protein
MEEVLEINLNRKTKFKVGDRARFVDGYLKGLLVEVSKVYSPNDAPFELRIKLLEQPSKFYIESMLVPASWLKKECCYGNSNISLSYG